MKYTISFLFMISFFSVRSQSAQNLEFEKTKGHLRFPLTRYSSYKNVEGGNSDSKETEQKSIVFYTDQDSVHAVFKGTVSTIFPMGDSYALITNYGDYFITYLNLDHPVFKHGDAIKAGQFLGLLVHPSKPNKLEMILTNKQDRQFDLYEWFGLNE